MSKNNVILKVDGNDYLMSLKDASTVMDCLMRSTALHSVWRFNMLKGMDAPGLRIEAEADTGRRVVLFDPSEEELFNTYIKAMESKKALDESNGSKFQLEDFHEWKKNANNQ